MPGSRGEASYTPHGGPVLLVRYGVYRVSTSDRDLLMKNIGLYFWFSSSLNKAALIEVLKPLGKDRVYRLLMD